mgnify:CR=1 FL=1
MEQIQGFLAQTREQTPRLLEIGFNIVAAFAILFTAWVIARILRRKIRKPDFGPDNLDITLRPVIASAVFYTIIAMALYAFLTKLGVPATSLLAIFGAAGLAIALALRDTLSNIAAGVMLLLLRPLQIGEFVDTSSYAGSVKEIGLFATTLVNSEGMYVYIPNSEVWRNRLQNYSRHSERKFIETIGVGYESDLRKTQQLLLDVMQATPDMMEYPSPPQCYIADFGESAIIISCRCWLPADDWMLRTSNLRIAMKEALDKEGIEIPFPQRVVTTKAG